MWVMSNRQQRRQAANRTVASLLSGVAAGMEPEAEAWARFEARRKWGYAQVRAYRRAQAKADTAWHKLVEPYAGWDDEDVPEIDPPPEQTIADAIFAEIRAVVEHDRWPRHLHWSL